MPILFVTPQYTQSAFHPVASGSPDARQRKSLQCSQRGGIPLRLLTPSTFIFYHKMGIASIESAPLTTFRITKNRYDKANVHYIQRSGQWQFNKKLSNYKTTPFIPDSMDFRD